MQQEDWLCLHFLQLNAETYALLPWEIEINQTFQYIFSILFLEKRVQMLFEKVMLYYLITNNVKKAVGGVWSCSG